MQKLSYLIVFLFSVLIGFAQSPHGDGFKTDCANCHNADTWKVTKADMTFDHNATKFSLTGQHQSVDCKSCHQTLKFQEAKTACVACHADMHTNTLGPDCARCHTPKTWIIENTKTMHQLSRFPLEGNHAVVDCASCHQSSTNLKFEPLGVECVDCHRKDYLGTTSPNHQKLGYSTNCTDCHGVKSTAWSTTNFDHSVFPLTGGHNISCLQCHKNGTYQSLSTECKSCHQTNYNATQIPNHLKAGISTDCKTCHTIADYKTSTFNHSTTNFPLTGAHAAVVQCSSCHLGNTTSAKSECISCHLTQYNGAKGHVASKFPTDCRVCHNLNNWLSSTFDHSKTNFPLTGAHTTAACASCHTTGYAGTSMECKTCHQTKYNTAKAPNHTAAGISVDCKTCHTTAAWQPSSFKHSSTGFDLTGAHTAIVQCSSCHVGNTTSASPNCISCHQAQYNGAAGHVASKFPTDCRLCHNNNNWLNATFNHSSTIFPLTGAHTTVACASCHTTGYAGTSMECKSCHQTKYNTAKAPNHTAAGISVDCKTCHTTAAWQPSSFKHSSTGFDLTGAHAALVQCSSCHLGNTTSASPNCISCHQTQYNLAKGHVASKFPTDCRLCHNNNNWLNATFNHSSTNFPLTGAHTTAACASCHTAGYAGTSMECKSCHQAKYNTAKTPNHTAAGISVDCKTCHTTAAWQPSSFKHSSTGFDLTGAHAALVQCSSCHLGNTTSASPNCISCHQTQYNVAKGHVASKFPTDCRLCHNNNNWLNATFNHSLTNFPLTGAHTTVACASCHTAGYAGTSMECKSCHQAKYNTAQSPNHTAAGISVDCKTCHTTAAWQPSSFKHSSTGFDLTGAHSTVVQCSSCHVGNTTSASPNCISCHQAQYNGAAGHVASKFPTDCRLCHNNNNWLNATFNHSSTNFPLTGAHTTVACASCHTTGYAGTSMECKSCHQAKYNTAQSPNHTAAGISVDCKTCHTTAAWQPSSFKHSSTGFTLAGAHASIVQCSSCHVGNTTSASPNCISCHQAQYNGAAGHVASKFPTDCTLCHNNNNWLGATFNHSSTNFPLTGAHTTVACASCHTTGYAGTSVECKTCHQTNYNTAVNPNHKTLGLSVTCTDCHTTNPGWQPANFPIHSTYYALTGAHATIANNCAACHNGNYTSTPNTCYACHTTDYNNTKNPVHKTSGFSTDCASCHKTTAWVPSTFNHTTYFPISSGKHTNISCVTCHTTPTNYTVFTCVTTACHARAHNRTQGSTGCYKCHPTGKGD